MRPLGRKRDSGIVLVFAYSGLEWFVLSSFIFLMRVVTRRMLPLAASRLSKYALLLSSAMMLRNFFFIVQFGSFVYRKGKGCLCQMAAVSRWLGLASIHLPLRIAM